MEHIVDHSPTLIAESQTFKLAGLGEVPQYKWIHVASGGQYLGHGQGQFTLTREVFESFQRNLRRDPRYQVGPVEVDGRTIQAGSKPTIQFDFEHSSEQPPFAGSIPQFGNPAPGWVLDLDIRTGPEGEPQLWSLSKLGDRIRGYIANDEYHQTSIAFSMKGKDFRTNESVGPVLTSIAFTNNPFLKQIESMAASRLAAQMASGAGAGQAAPSGVEPSASGVAPLESPNGDPTMSDADAKNLFERFRLAVCSALNIRTLANDEEIVKAAEDASAGAAVADAGAASVGTDREGFKAALEGIMAEREMHAQALAEIDAMLQGGAAADQQVAAEDVAAVMTAQSLGDNALLRDALTARRSVMLADHMKSVPLQAKWDRHTPTQLMNETRVARQHFLSAHGIQPAGEGAAIDHKTLTTSLVAAAGGAQLTPPAVAPVVRMTAAPAVPASRVIPPEAASPPAGGVIDVRALSGRNATEKVFSHLRANDASFQSLSWEEQCRHAYNFRQTHQVQV